MFLHVLQTCRARLAICFRRRGIDSNEALLPLLEPIGMISLSMALKRISRALTAIRQTAFLSFASVFRGLALSIVGGFDAQFVKK